MKSDIFFNEGVLHKANGPSRIWGDGVWDWWLHGERHRYYGPAQCIGCWYIHGDMIKHDQIKN